MRRHRRGNPAKPPGEVTPLVEEITRLYWDENARVDDIVDRFGFRTRRQVLEHVMPMGFEKSCRECKTSFVVMFRNRTEVNCAHSHENRQFASGWICDDCLVANSERQAALIADSEMRQRMRARGEADQRHALKSMPYREYLQSDHWRKTREQAISKAGGRCQMCNRSDRLHVHHRTYVRRGEERMSDLLVLCETCHHEFHDRIGMPV